jgi:hypothetical protein
MLTVERKTNVSRFTTVPFSELALHLGIAGKRVKIVEQKGRWVLIKLDGRCYEGLLSELVDIEDR